MEQHRFKHIFLLLLILNLVAFHLSEGKRSLSGRSRTSSSGSRSSTRRTQSNTQTHYSPAPSSSSIGKAPNADHVKLSYGGVNSQPPSTQNKPIGWSVPGGPPPAYSAHNVAGGAKTNIHEQPPAYKPNYAAPPAYPGNNQQSGSSYPKQVYNTASQPSGGSYPHNTGAVNTGRTIHNTGYRPHNGTGGYGGNYSPAYAQTMRPLTAAGSGTYHNQGSIQPGFYPHQTAGFPQGGSRPPMPPGGFPAGMQPIGGGFPAGVQPVGTGHFAPSGGFASYPQQAAPVYQGSGIQPGFYPAGTFPQKSSGPGLGTGLIAGAIGGAILGHALTPTHTHHVVSGGSGVSSANNDQDRIIVINNNPGQPVSVTNGNGQPASGVSVIQPAAPATPAAGNPEPPIPLSPFPSQQQAQSTGTQTNQQPNPAIGVASSGAALANAAATGSADTVPLAPFPNNTTDGQQANPNATQPQYGTYCVPVLVNVTDPNNTANVTTVEQVYCYQVVMPPQEQQVNPPIQNSNVLQQGQPNDFSNMPTQRTSTASLAANSNIKNGVKSNIVFASTISFINTILTSVIVFSISAYIVH